VGASIVVNKATRKLGAAHHEFAGVMTLFFPALLGFSLISLPEGHGFRLFLQLILIYLGLQLATSCRDAGQRKPQP
jgi:hypothetical protein